VTAAAADQRPAGSLWGALAIIALALVLRAGLFPFAENKHGDAPMRALIAEWLNIDPHAAADPRTYCQFGPLHTSLMRPFLALDPVAPRSSRYLSLIAGMAVFFPFWRLARRLAPPQHAPLAALALAVSPLHIQASITASSEALYLLLMVTCLERLLAALQKADGDGDGDGRLATFAVAGLLASLAAVTRYDAWIDFPLVLLAAWFWGARQPAGRARRWTGLALFAAATASLPLAWIAWGARATDDPFFFAHYISSDHAHLAAAVSARWGPLAARARQLGIWSLAFVAAMSLPMLAAAAIALSRIARLPAAAKIVVVAALAPPALYLAKGLLLLSFEPLPRFALIPGALLLPLAAEVAATRWRPGRCCASIVASAALLSAVVLLVAWHGPGRVWSGAESFAPMTRLDGEDRALADYLRAHRQPDDRVLIEPLDFADIVIAHAARIPAPLTVSLSITRHAEPTLAATLARTGARWLAVYDDERADASPESWGRRFAAEWPPDSQRFGHWRLLHRP
jgi:4-amino-4-deoxy-L-arabinose transferase-like glycosyltransferase